MAIDFNKLNLEIIDTNINMSPDIFVNATGITFSKRAVEELGYPAHVQYLIDAENKVFAVRASRHDGTKSVSFSKPRSEQKATISIGNRNVWEPVKKMMQGVWLPERRYRVTGFMLDDKKTMVFVLPEGVVENYRILKDDVEKE